MSINNDEAFNISVNTMILTESEIVIMIGRSTLLSDIELPIMTGRTGSIHGARMVSIPARKATVSKNVFINSI